MFDKRLAHLRQICKENSVDSFLVSTTYNIFYLCGFDGYIADEREGFLFVTKDNVYMLTSPLYTDAVKRISPQVTLLTTSGKAWYTELLKDIIAKEHIKSIGFEDHDLRYIEYEEFYHVAELVPFTLRTLRLIKDANEIQSIQNACTLADQLFDYIRGKIHPGMSEKEVALEMELYVRKHNAVLSFPSIVAFGQNAAAIHHVPTEKILEKGQCILLDFGVKIDNYCSDISRTLFSATPTDEEKKMYQAVKEAQENAISYVAAQWNSGNTSISTHEIDEKAREILANYKLPTFPHALGHGIGLEVHEGPTVSHNAKDRIEVGMVYTIEPGLYFSNKMGVRIEDMFTLTTSGPKQLTNSSKELLVI